jgi:hypothetical protein
MRYFMFALLLLLLLLPLRAHASDSVVLQEQAGSCFATVEAIREQGLLSVRMSREDESSLSCGLDRGQTLNLLGHIADALEKQGDRTVYTGIFLRQLRNYDWLARQLAETAAHDLGWNNAMGTPADMGDLNGYANRILSDPAILAAMGAAAPRWRFTGFSCEKIFVSGPQTTGIEPSWLDPSQRLPFDGTCWIGLDRGL